MILRHRAFQRATRSVLRIERLEDRRCLASIESLDNLIPVAISGDGKTVTGYDSAGWVATRLGSGVVTRLNFQPKYVSFDGSVIVGSPPQLSNELPSVLRWENGVVIPIGEQNGFLPATVSGMSDDGKVLVGTSEVPALRQPDLFGVRRVYKDTVWQEGRGIREIPLMAESLSGNGSVIAGSQGFFAPEKVTWTEASGIQLLPRVTFVQPTRVIAASCDGSVLTGFGLNDAAYPIVWKPPLFAGSINGIGYPTDISSDGNVIVGRNFGFGSSQRAFLWTEDFGFESLDTALSDRLGVNLGNWTLSQAVAVSNDGSVIVGVGSRTRLEQGWVVHLENRIGSSDANCRSTNSTMDAKIDSVAILDRRTLQIEVENTRLAGNEATGIVRVFRSGDDRLDPLDLEIIFDSVSSSGTDSSVTSRRQYELSLINPLELRIDLPYLIVEVMPKSGSFDPDLRNNISHVTVEGIDRWWATAGLDATIDINWVSYVSQPANFLLRIEIDTAGLLGTEMWRMPADIEAFSVDGRSVSGLLSETEFSANVSLGLGFHIVSVRNLRVPTTPDVDSIIFRLGSQPAMNALLIADHNERNLPLTPSERDRLIVQHAPVLRFVGSQVIGGRTRTERFPYTFDASLTSWRYRGSQRDQPNRKLVLGESTDYIDLRTFQPNAPNADDRIYAPSAELPATMYASILFDRVAQVGRRTLERIAINYWFHYPRSNWGEQGGYNTHEGDWEGVTVYVERDAGMETWVPKSMALAQHVRSTIDTGGSIVPWNELTFTSSDQRRPLVFVGLGGHATYARAGVRTIGLIYDEFFTGNGVEYAPTTVQYLPRVSSNLGRSLEWLLYSGRWGNADLDPDWIPNSLDGDTGPRGPVFLESGFDPGTRWLNPWDWSSEFTNARIPTIDIGSKNTSDLVYGQTAEFTVRVSPVISGGRIPEGSVRLIVDGFEVGGLIALVDGSASISAPKLTAGQHTIEFIYLNSDGNYENRRSSPVAQFVNRALLRVSALDAQKLTGEPIPAFPVAYSGFIAGDNVGNSVMGNPSITVSPQSVHIAGSYPITLGNGSLASNNYSFLFTNATLLVYSAIVNRAIAFPGFGSSVDTSKHALLPGETASFQNYTNFVGGLTELIVDVAGVSNAAVSQSNFQFATWNAISTEGFQALNALPTITVLANENQTNATRIRMQFQPASVRNTWLRVTMLSNSSTWLRSDELFYFGSAIGDVDTIGNSASEVRVNALDIAAVRANQSPGPNSVSISNIYDLNKDGRVNSLDVAIVRANQADPAIGLFVAPGGNASLAMLQGDAETEPRFSKGPKNSVPIIGTAVNSWFQIVASLVDKAHFTYVAAGDFAAEFPTLGLFINRDGKSELGQLEFITSQKSRPAESVLVDAFFGSLALEQGLRSDFCQGPFDFADFHDLKSIRMEN